jgi:hypothetical protein
MPRFDVLPFKPDDYVAIVPPRADRDLWADGATYARYGPAYTAWVDGQVAAVAGVMITTPGVGHAWAVLGPLGFAHPGFVHRAVCRQLREIVTTHRLIRVDAEVLKHFAAGRRWAERLGLTFESEKPYAAPGRQHFVVYAWLGA